jgi:hypothetical protein
MLHSCKEHALCLIVLGMFLLAIAGFNISTLTECEYSLKSIINSILIQEFDISVSNMQRIGMFSVQNRAQAGADENLLAICL